jgi:hypothetical protein
MQALDMSRLSPVTGYVRSECIGTSECAASSDHYGKELNRESRVNSVLLAPETAP